MIAYPKRVWEACVNQGYVLLFPQFASTRVESVDLDDSGVSVA
jgi:hypothetical protein